MNIDLINFVLRGKRRKDILKLLNKQPKTSGLIARELKISITNMPKFLNELVEKKLIIIENEEQYHYKLYKISEKGKEILEEIEKIE